MKPLILATILLALTPCSHAQLTKPQQQSVVFLHAPGRCNGTGFFVSGRTIITASHVAQTTVLEAWIGGKRYYATVQKRNAGIDYCELRIRGYKHKSPLRKGGAQWGETLYTYGYPESKVLEGSWGQLGYKCGFYYVNGMGLQGLSGGPVVNSKGLAVGWVTNQHFDGGTLFRSWAEVAE